jgi:hypothetical protein
MQGPRIRIEMSCFDCDYCVSESYRVQGDSGSDVYCLHPSIVPTAATPRKYIGDSSWSTPIWCPLRQVAIDKMISGLSGVNDE